MSQQQSTTKRPDALLDAGVFSRPTNGVSEPDWLQSQRTTGWSSFEEIPMPTTSDEAWRRTNLKRIKWGKFQVAGTSSVEKTDSLSDLPDQIQAAVDADRPAAGRLIIANDQIVFYDVDANLAEQGVIFTDLASAVANHSDLVQKHLAGEAVPPSHDKFSALNTALWQNGVFLYLPKEVEIEAPFQVAFVIEGEGTAIFPRTLIVAEELASATYIEENVSLSDHGQALNMGVTEVYAANSAQVRHVDVQRLGTDVYNFNVKRSIGDSDSMVIWETGQLGGRITKNFYDSVLPGNGAMMEFNGIYFMEGKQHLDIDSLIHHIGVATGGDLLLHGAVKDKSRQVFTGLIKIADSGQQTNSYLKNENLLLDRTARADSMPSLEIDANDVRASHGATIGQIDEEDIFYLMSRGVPRETAVRMVVEGFFYRVFDRMYNERVREKLFNAVSAKLGGRGLKDVVELELDD